MTTLDDSQQMDWLGTESSPMSSPEGSRANRTAARLEAETLRTGSQRSSVELSGSSNRNTSLPRMSQKKHFQSGLSAGSGHWGTPSVQQIYQRLTLGQTIREIVGGSLHTPTTMANFRAPSMQKHGSCVRFGNAFGGQKITPEQFEFLMGYPIGHTDLER